MSNGYGYAMGGANKPAKPGYGGNGHGAKPNGYNVNGAGSMSPKPGYTNGAGIGSFGSKPKGYGSATAGTGATKGNGAKTNGYGVPGQTARVGNAGYGIPSGKTKPAGGRGGQGLKGGLFSAAQPTAAPPQGFAPQGFAPQGFAPQGFAPQGFAPQGFAPQGFAPQGFAPQGFAPQLSQGGAPMGQKPSDALLGMMTPDQYQKLQGKVFSPEALPPQATAGPALGPQYTLQSGPTLMGSGGKSSKISGAAALQPSALPSQG
ncbi:uncharacterized protein [Eucyclogobius newberryi]|uniref:uncharacterized protein n=1 Tax=Eucyclogobius newberryi TaxID=166745 RepID=UPI003B593A3F